MDFKILFCLNILFFYSVEGSIKYNRKAKNKNVRAVWLFDDKEGFFYCKIQSPYKTGWVGIGFNNKYTMKGEDCVVGWVDERGRGHLEDRHAVENAEPILDEKQDYHLLSYDTNENGTTIEFKRKIKTCDPNDYEFAQDHTNIMFVYSEETPSMRDGRYVLPFHRGNRFGSVELIEFTSQELDINLQKPEDADFDFLVNYENFTIPSATTTYWCQIIKIPQELRTKKHTFIGWQVELQEGHDKYLHHASMGQCLGDPAVLEKRAQRGGWDCTNAADAVVDFLGCLPIMFSFTVGAVGEYYDNDIGFPIGQGFDGSNFLYYQAHYTNENNERGIKDVSGVRMFFTTKPRTHIAGSLMTMSRVDYTLLIPPKQPSFGYSVTCPQSCLNNLPDEGVTAFGIYPHMHVKAVRVRIRHFDKNGVEKPTLYEDKSYSFNSQESSMFRKRVKIEKGDSILTECYYDTTKDNKNVLGGLSSYEEMCVSILFIYPLLKDFNLCSVTMDKNEQVKFFGITKYNASTDEVLEPKNLAGKNITDVLSEYEWTPTKVEEFEQLTLYGKKSGQCLGIGGKNSGEIMGSINITREYKKPKDKDCQC